MLMYEIKIVCQVSNEVLFYSLEKKPNIPSVDQMKKYPGILIITTLDSAVAKKQQVDSKTVNKKVA